MLVKERMTTPAVTIFAQTTIKDARDLMIEHDISRIPVIDERERIVGIIVFHDIDRSLHVPGFIPEVPVEWIMSKNPVTIDANVDIKEAAKLMLNHRIAGLPVVKSDKVVGVITETDLLKILIENI